MKKNNFQDKMEKSLVDFKENHQFLPSVSTKKRWHYFDFSDNIFPPVKHSLLQLIYDSAIPLHDFSNHVRSSQAFCFNVFYPLLLKEQSVLIDFFSELIGFSLKRISHFSFEYQPELDSLGEWKGSEKPEEYVTAADLLISFETKEQGDVKILFEVKFTEDSFSKCGGYSSNGNDTRENCENWNSVVEDPINCYLQRPAKGRSARTYFDFFSPLSTSFPQKNLGKCPFIENHQALRLLAFAKSMEEKNVTTFLALLYHDGNNEIEDKWHSFSDLVSKDLSKKLLLIPASKMISRSQDENYKNYMRKRYKIL